jgi:Fe-S oxidoreductase
VTEFQRLSKHREPLEYCIRCGFCKAICPAVSELGWDSASARGRMTFIKAILDGDIEVNEKAVERLFQCTTCGDCKERCPPGVKTLDIIEDARADLVDMGLGPKKHRILRERIDQFYNPYGAEMADKNKFKRDDETDTLYFIGCTAAFRRPETVIATMDILDAAGVKYRVLGEDEWCCGSVMRRSGYPDVAEELRDHNVNEFEKAGIKTIVTSCSGCYRTLKKEYEMEGIEVLDITELVDRLMEQEKLSIGKSEDFVTYHDPCHLGRHMKVFDSPRKVLDRIATLVEMEHCRENSLCCGAGGGVKSFSNDLAINIAKKRVEEANTTKAQMIITPCPFCRMNLSDAAEGCIPVVDFTEYVSSKIRSN